MNTVKTELEIVYVDLDDTMCNFGQAYARAIARNPKIMFPQSQLKFFENLAPVKGAIEGFNKLTKRYDVRILTAPSVYNPLSYMEKRLWVEKYLGLEVCNDLIICQDKTALRGKYLIDDWPQMGSFKPEWEQIRIFSKDFPSWDAVIKYLMK